MPSETDYMRLGPWLTDDDALPVMLQDKEWRLPGHLMTDPTFKVSLAMTSLLTAGGRSTRKPC